jgi:hypothetical protein
MRRRPIRRTSADANRARQRCGCSRLLPATWLKANLCRRHGSHRHNRKKMQAMWRSDCGRGHELLCAPQTADCSRTCPASEISGEKERRAQRLGRNSGKKTWSLEKVQEVKHGTRSRERVQQVCRARLRRRRKRGQPLLRSTHGPGSARLRGASRRLRRKQ